MTSANNEGKPLEELLAERLYQAVPRGMRADFRPWSSISAQGREPFMCYAREALRCMEWAKEPARRVLKAVGSGAPLMSNQGQAMDGFSELANYRAAAEAPLTLPPPGWSPASAGKDQP